MTDREESLWFQELYFRFAKSLVRFSCRAGIELEISKEIMQQAFYLLLVKYDSLKDWHTNLPGWLIKTNSNLIKKELNAPRRKHEIPLADWLEVQWKINITFPWETFFLPDCLSGTRRFWCCAMRNSSPIGRSLCG